MWDSKDFSAKGHEKISNFQPLFSRQKIQLEINKEKNWSVQIKSISNIIENSW